MSGASHQNELSSSQSSRVGAVACVHYVDVALLLRLVRKWLLVDKLGKLTVRLIPGAW